ncbi:CASP-like protein 4A1 [Cucumis melo var. makuwa]|uniref:CASP-like protein 4A1 n=1 Tax=Cucumis melo var. makuwa TaxID=1194695 RepID=A0A5A7SX81_CUCMM|nr:CASP-like protein 4A1 [Cucumis melo var. makuwa]
MSMSSSSVSLAVSAQSHHFPTGSTTYLNYLTTATTGTAHVELPSSLSLLFSYSLSSSPFIFSLFQPFAGHPDYASAVAFLRSQAQEIGLHTQALEFGPGKPLLLVTWYGSYVGTEVASANPPSPRPVAANRAQPSEPIVVTKVDTEIQLVRKVEEVSDSDGDGDVESADGGKVGRGRKLMERV